MSEEKKSRYWHSLQGSSTAVLWRAKDNAVLMHTNLGWVGPVEVELGEGETVEMVAERIALGYELDEIDFALFMEQNGLGGYL